MPTVASPRPSFVASEVDTTSLERAGISTGSPKSERTNTMPVFARAGCSVSCAAAPLWSPTPVHETFSAIVLLEQNAPPSNVRNRQGVGANVCPGHSKRRAARGRSGRAQNSHEQNQQVTSKISERPRSLRLRDPREIVTIASRS